MAKIGKLIKEKREALGITQEELAERLGYKHKSSINKIELNKVDFPRDRVQDFAEALGIPASELITDDEAGLLGNILRPDEFSLLMAYRSASSELRRAVLSLLGIK